MCFEGAILKKYFGKRFFKRAILKMSVLREKFCKCFFLNVF